MLEYVLWPLKLMLLVMAGGRIFMASSHLWRLFNVVFPRREPNRTAAPALRLVAEAEGRQNAALTMWNVLDAASSVFVFPFGRDATKAYAKAEVGIEAHARRRGISTEDMVTRYYAERFAGQVVAFLGAMALLGSVCLLPSRLAWLAMALAAALPLCAFGLRCAVSHARRKGWSP
jgi:hypothetical protein